MKHIRLLSILALCLFACLLIACNSGGTEDSTTPSETDPSAVTDVPTEPPAETESEAVTHADDYHTHSGPGYQCGCGAWVTERETLPPGEEEITMGRQATIPVIVDGKTDYTVIASAVLQEQNTEDLTYLFSVMDAKYGAHPEVGTEGTKTISLVLNNAMDALDYQVRVIGDTKMIELFAGSPEAMSRAIRYFVTQYCGYSDGDLLVPVENYTYTYAEAQIDNSHFLSYEGGDKTVLAPSDKDGTLMTPAWLDTAVMVELRIDMASIGGAFKDSYDLIDFYAATGVNVLWLSPIYERGAGGNGYGNIGLHRIEPALTGTTDQAEGWNELKKFVDYAHSKGVYILLDIISWGTMYASPLLEEHPEWYDGEAWGNAAFNWKNEEFREWFISNAVENLKKTGADGYRCDCEPFTAGYEVFEAIRTRCNDQGLYPVIMAEAEADRKNVFDMEQDGVIDMDRGTLYQHPVNFFVDGHLSIVSDTLRGKGVFKRGAFRYYTNCITNHDYQERNVNGNRLKIGYAAIYAPYIPLWYMGDEFGVTMPYRAVLYDIAVDYGSVGSNAEQTYFYEDVKQMIAIRRTYPEIFEYYPLSHKQTNICEVAVDGLTSLENYARYADNKMVIVLANNEEGNNGVCTVKIPFEDGFATAYKNYKVTDLLTGRVIAMGHADRVDDFSAVVPYQYCGVYLVEGIE
ncbi:MAG: hypothetical protein E7645_00630 [Ruminococcaceae bacterium]|nr:hypothetical protein [Oscillospiraceae bacterium]